MDWTQIIQMIFGGSIVAGIVEVCAAIRAPQGWLECNLLTILL